MILTLGIWIGCESTINAYLDYFLTLALFIILVIKFFKKTPSKKINIYILIVVSLIILNGIYYNNLSMKIEPLIHMHNKYNIPYSSMEIIETKKSNNPIVGIYQPRETIIKIDNKYISLYYGSKYTSDKEGWKDDYHVSKLLSQVLNEFINDYKYSIDYIDYDANYYEYVILMRKNDLYKMSTVIEKLNLMTKYVQNFNYNITFVDNYRYEAITIANKTSFVEYIAYINYSNVDNYYDKNDFLSKQHLTDIQRKKIEETDFDGFEFIYYGNNDNIDIKGYKYKK